MSNNLFTVAGTATNPDGVTKVRWANDLVTRIKILNKTGCTNINLVELPNPMTKLEALTYLKTLDLGVDAAYAVAVKLAEKQSAARREQNSAALKFGNVKTGRLADLKHAADYAD